MRYTPALTVGELIDELQKHPRKAKARMCVNGGIMDGVGRVEVFAGRVCMMISDRSARPVRRLRR